MTAAVYVYGLFDPRDERVRYVGVTTDIEARLCVHRSPDPACGERLGAWLSGLRAESVEPCLRVLEELAPGADVREAEARWIASFPDLLNDPSMAGCGRPESQNPKRERIAFYLAPDVAALVRESAQREGDPSISSWVSRVVTAAARRR